MDQALKLVRIGAAAVLFAIAFHAALALAAREVPWPDTLFERVSFEEDVKDIIRGLARQGGLQVIFRPGVEGEVTFEFKNMPLEAAFNKLITEHNLEYDFDPETKLLTVFSAALAQRQRSFIPLEHVSPNEVMAAAKRFNLGGGYSVDPVAKTAFIEGTTEQVKAFRSLVERLDAAAGARQQAAVSRQKAQIAREKSAVRKRLLQQLLDRKIKVFELRFANVAATKITFHGSTVTLPGIEDTLRALIGDVKVVTKELSEEKQKAIKAKEPTAGASFSVSADPRTNSIIVRGTDEDISRVERVITELDRPVPMVEIDVMIVRAQRGISQTLGVNWAYERNLTGVAPNQVFGLNTGITGADPSGIVTGVGTEPEISASGGAGLNTIGATAEQPAAIDNIDSSTQSILAGFVLQGDIFALQAQLEAFEEDNKTQTIASPTLVTLNNVEAKIERRASQFFDVGQNTTATLQEVNVGLSLEMTPAVIPREDATEEELIRLTLKARNTAISAGTFSASTASTSGQELETEVIVPSGRTFMIGGLVDDSRTDSVKGVPLLKDIPVLGQLFRTDSSNDEFVETIFFVTPRVVHPEEILPRDIAERRYVMSRRFGLAQTRKAVQEGSTVLSNVVAYQEEDE